MERNSRIFVAGHQGLVGAGICRRLREMGYTKLVLRGRNQLDLRNRAQVDQFIRAERPDYVFLAAAKVGGILANQRFPAEFIFDNLTIQTNVIDASWRGGVRKLQLFGSSCMYPKLAPQPIREESLLTGALENTSAPYAIAKIAAIQMAEAYRRQYGFCTTSIVPANLYGPGDDFDPETSHVVAALIRRFHEAKISGTPRVVVWGSGRARREFLHVDDLAAAAVFLMQNYDGADLVNIGTGNDIEIEELANMIAEIAAYEGEIVFEVSKPDGAPRKLLDTTRLTGLGWRSGISLRDGLRQTFDWYVGSPV